MNGATKIEIGQSEGRVRFRDSKGGGSAALLLRVCDDGVGRGVRLDVLDDSLIIVDDGEGVISNVFIGADVAFGTRDS